jgi:intein/homing endonuclease
LESFKIKDSEKFFNKEWQNFKQFKKQDNTLTCKQHISLEEDNYQIMTSSGFSKVQRVIRHKTTKKMYRVHTSTGIIEVTEDHSLIKSNGDLLLPGKAKLGDELMYSII